MARKIKFALEMKNGIKVRRSLDELRENFDLAKAKEYYASGQLAEWLEDRYYDDEASKIRSLDTQSVNFSQKLCEALGVTYVENEDVETDLETVSRTNEKKALLRQKTSDEEIIAHAATTAFSQEDLADLLDEDTPVIYLCGETFTIPIRVSGKKYIGILGKPKVIINAASYTELVDQQITFANVEIEAHMSDSVPSSTSEHEESPAPHTESSQSTETPVHEDTDDFPWQPKLVDGQYRYGDDNEDGYGGLTKGELRKILSNSSNIRDDRGERWQFASPDYSGPDATDRLGKLEKRMALKLICKNLYSEKDILRISVDKEVTGGCALTFDSVCFGGVTGNAIIPYDRIIKVSTPVTYSWMEIVFQGDSGERECIKLKDHVAFYAISSEMIRTIDVFLETVKNYTA